MFKQSRVSYDLKAKWGNHGEGGMQKWLMEHFLGTLAWRPIDLFGSPWGNGGDVGGHVIGLGVLGWDLVEDLYYHKGSKFRSQFPSKCQGPWCVVNAVGNIPMRLSYLLHVGRGGACGLVCWPSVLGFEGGAARRDGAFQSWSHCRVRETFELNQLKSAPSQLLPVFSGFDRLQTCCH